METPVKRRKRGIRNRPPSPDRSERRYDNSVKLEIGVYVHDRERVERFVASINDVINEL